MRDIATKNVWSVFGLMMVTTTIKAEQALHLTTGPELQLPSIWRVAGGFLLMVGLAVAIVVVLKRIQPWMPKSALNKDGIVVISSRILSRKSTAYVLKVGGEQYLLIESGATTLLRPLIHNSEQAVFDKEKSGE